VVCKMATYIINVNIKAFRGLANLEIENLSDVNILVGDNNTGKTSILEAVQLFCEANQYNMAKIAMQREMYKTSKNRNDLVDTIKYLFNFESQHEDTKKIHIISNMNSEDDVNREESRYIFISGEKEKQIIGKNFEEEISVFFGYIEKGSKVSSGQIKIDSRIEYEYRNNSRIRESIKNKAGSINVAFVSAMAHVAQDSFRSIAKKPLLIKQAVELLKAFDANIKSMTYQPGDEQRYVPVFEVEGMEEYVPLALYGDGMKKALTILNAIIEAENGIVLIDEFETALHTTAMAQVLKFMLTVAKDLNVQLFLTTHSLEAIDTLLKCDEENVDRIKVVRIRKKENRVYADTIDGAESLYFRKKYKSELRI